MALDSSVRLVIARAVKDLEVNPTPASSKQLGGLPYRRLRVGDYRVIYAIEGGLVRVYAVGHRREIYQVWRRKMGALYTPEELAAYPEHVTADGYLLADLSGARPNLNADGTVTLYHRTTEAGAEGILRDRAFRSNEMGRVYFSTLTHGNATAERNDIIEVPVDPSVLHIDGIYQDEVFVWADESEVDDAAITRRFKATKRATTDHTYHEWCKKVGLELVEDLSFNTAWDLLQTKFLWAGCSSPVLSVPEFISRLKRVRDDKGKLWSQIKIDAFLGPLVSSGNGRSGQAT